MVGLNTCSAFICLVVSCSWFLLLQKKYMLCNVLSFSWLTWSLPKQCYSTKPKCFVFFFKWYDLFLVVLVIAKTMLFIYNLNVLCFLQMIWSTSILGCSGQYNLSVLCFLHMMIIICSCLLWLLPSYNSIIFKLHIFTLTNKWDGLREPWRQVSTVCVIDFYIHIL